jgi:ornithine decarboxylase
MKNHIETPYFKYCPRRLEVVLKDFQALQERGIEIYYAVKANHDARVIESVAGLGMGFDVASINEIKHVLQHGGKADNLVFAAPAKKEKDVLYAKEVGITKLMADTVHGVDLIASVYKEQAHSIILRMEAHGARAVFDLSDKFGLSNEEAIRILIKSAEKKYSVEGVTFHVGSQNLDLDAWHNAFNSIIPVLDAFKKYGLNLKYIDFGGGIPAKYNSESLKRSVYAKAVLNLANFIKSRYPEVHVLIEPGRVIASEVYDLYTSIVDIKDYKKKTVLIVDTSVFIGLIEAIYELNYPISLVRKSNVPRKEFTIGGITCDGCDIIYKSIWLPSDIKIDDVLKITRAGSYTSSWENVHLHSWPNIL